jgi:Zn-dependent protease with chaperone function
MGVYSGLLKFAKNQDQLATVLGHEVGHVIAKHGAERVSESLLTQGGMAALDGMMRDPDGRLNLFGALGIAGLKLGVELPHSRTQESEADQIGLDLDLLNPQLESVNFIPAGTQVKVSLA